MLRHAQSAPQGVSPAHATLARLLPNAEIISDSEGTAIDLNRDGYTDITHAHGDRVTRIHLRESLATADLNRTRCRNAGDRREFFTRRLVTPTIIETNVVTTTVDPMASQSQLNLDAAYEQVAEVADAVNVFRYELPLGSSTPNVRQTEGRL